MLSFLAVLWQGLKRQPTHDPLLETDRPSIRTLNLGHILSFMRNHWKMAALGIILLFINRLVILPQPLIYRFVIDDLIVSKRPDWVKWLIGVGALYLLLKLTEKISGLLQNYTFTRFEQYTLVDIKSDLFERVLHFPKAFFDQQQTGYLMNRLSEDVEGLHWFFSGTIVGIASDFLLVIGGIILLFTLEWRLTILLLLTLPGLIVATHFFSGKLRNLNSATMEQYAQVNRTLQESLSSSLLIKAFAREAYTAQTLRSQWATARQVLIELTTLDDIARYAIGFLPALFRLLVFALGIIWILQGSWSLGSMLAFVAYLDYIYGPALRLAQSNLELQAALAALQRVSAIYKIVPEENETGLLPAKLHGQVEFRQVSFAYDQREPVLIDVSFTAQPGEHVAIVGPSGVGKTTLVSLLLAFYRPTSGAIFVDGRPASDYSSRGLRQRIGYVMQTTQLLSGTILENLRYGNPEANMEEVIQAAKIAGIHEFITNLPQGYESCIGENGINLSEGQKQRLSIARALIKDPDILVLDEPTASLDSFSEKTIFEILPSFTRKKTLFIIAHRLSTIQKADRILLFNEHRLVASGTHQELFSNNSYYRNLVATQDLTAAAMN